MRLVARPQHRRPQDPSRSLLNTSSPHPTGTAATAAPTEFCLLLPSSSPPPAQTQAGPTAYTSLGSLGVLINAAAR